MILNIILVVGSIALIYLFTWMSFGAEGMAPASSEKATKRKEKPKALMRFLLMWVIISVAIYFGDAIWWKRVGIIAGCDVAILLFLVWFSTRTHYSNPMK